MRRYYPMFFLMGVTKFMFYWQPLLLIMVSALLTSL